MMLIINSFTLSAVEYLSLLGSVPVEVINNLGSPYEVGTAKVKDEPLLVYFLYEDYMYTLFYDNRVWGIRFDSRFRGNVLGLKIGISIEECQRILSQQFGHSKSSLKDSLVYSLPFQGFSAEIRVFFMNKKLVEIYLYRSDY